MQVLFIPPTTPPSMKSTRLQRFTARPQHPRGSLLVCPSRSIHAHRAACRATYRVVSKVTFRAMCLVISKHYLRTYPSRVALSEFTGESLTLSAKPSQGPTSAPSVSTNPSFPPSGIPRSRPSSLPSVLWKGAETPQVCRLLLTAGNVLLRFAVQFHA